VKVGSGRAGLLRPLAERDFRPRRRVTAMYAAWIPSGLLVAGLGMTRTVVLVALLYGLVGVLFEFGNLIWATLLGVTVVLTGGGLLSVPITLAGLLWRGVRDADQPAS
jgi:hypothetical protein